MPQPKRQSRAAPHPLGQNTMTAAGMRFRTGRQSAPGHDPFFNAADGCRESGWNDRDGEAGSRRDGNLAVPTG